MTWDYLQTNFPWGVVLLVGGGFAISDGAQASGLSAWLGEQLNGLESLPQPLLLLLVLGILSVFTEVSYLSKDKHGIISILCLFFSDNVQRCHGVTADPNIGRVISPTNPASIIPLIPRRHSVSVCLHPADLKSSKRHRFLCWEDVNSGHGFTWTASKLYLLICPVSHDHFLG